MFSLEKTIEKNNLISKGDTVGVAVSGGADSMSLLHYLNANSKSLGIEIVAVNVNHQIRENSKKDSDFVADYCKNAGIRCHTFKVDVLKLADLKKMTVEEGAREARYGVFDALLKKGIVNKIAIAHHMQDQVETILLNILRGSGLKGAGGMEIKRGEYIRPLLNTSKQEILSYITENNIPFVEDESNYDTDFSRNYLRNKVLPLIKEQWKSADINLLNFGAVCREDDFYINSTICFDQMILDKDSVKIPLNMFVYKPSVINRLIRRGFEHLGLLKDIEKKHLEIIRKLVKEGENGAKISLPNSVTAHKEYDYLTLSIKKPKEKAVAIDFKQGKQLFKNGVEITVKKTKDFELKQDRTHIFDGAKLPQKAVWRTREEGDVFEKFGGGTKKLKDYFIDKKIPLRLRNEIPLLASGREIYVILGVEISDKIKIDETTKQAYIVKF